MGAGLGGDMLLYGLSVWNDGLWLWSGVIDFALEKKPSKERNMSKAKLCFRCLILKQEDLLDGIKRLDLDMRNGRRGRPGTFGVCAYSGDEHRSAVNTLQKLCG